MSDDDKNNAPSSGYNEAEKGDQEREKESDRQPDDAARQDNNQDEALRTEKTYEDQRQSLQEEEYNQDENDEIDVASDDSKTSQDDERVIQLSRPGIILFWLMAGFVIAVVFFLSTFEVETVISGQGAVEPGAGIKPIESREGGIIEKIFVKEGDKMEEGDPLVRVANINVSSKHQEITSEISVIKAKRDRLQAELRGDDRVQWSEGAREAGESVISDQKDLFDTRRSKREAELESIRHERQGLKEDLNSARRELDALDQEMNITRQLVQLRKKGYQKKWASEVDLLTAKSNLAAQKRRYTNLQGKIASLKEQVEEAQQRFQQKRQNQRQETLDALEEVTLRLRKLKASMDAASEKEDRRVLRAPAAGTVNRIHVNAGMDVVEPGERIIDIVPKGVGLTVEGRINPSNRSGLYVDLPAKVDFTALRDKRIGPVEARVTFVGADTQEDKDGNTFYKIRVKTEKNVYHNPKGEEVIIGPGMVGRINVIVGEHTIGSYLMRPIIYVFRQSFNER